MVDRVVARRRRRDDGLVPRTGFALSLILLLLAGGCDISVPWGERILETDQLEEVLVEEVGEQLDREIESVSCPRDVEMREGNDFRCTARPEEGEPIVIDVTQDDDEGNVTWRVRTG